MKNIITLIAILICAQVNAQMINPVQIRPGTEGQVLKTINGYTVWDSLNEDGSSHPDLTNYVQFNDTNTVLPTTSNLIDTAASLRTLIGTKQNQLNGTGFVKASGTTITYDNSTYTPTNRTISINGNTQDLSANRSWTIPTVDTTSLSNRINTKQNYSDTISWDASKTWVVLQNYLKAEIDGDTLNEIQTLSRRGDSILLSKGGWVVDSFARYSQGSNITITGTYPDYTISAQQPSLAGYMQYSDTSGLIGTKSNIANVIRQGGNSFGAVMHIGTNDNNSVRVRVNNTGVASFGSSGQLITTGNIATNGNVTDAAPPYSVTIPSSGNGIAAYNTADQTTNYERVRQYWGANEYYIRMERGGTGSLRNLRYQDFNSVTYAGTGVVFGNGYQSGGATNLTLFNNGLTTTTSATQNQTTIAPTINQGGTAGFRALWVTPYIQGAGSGAIKLLLDIGKNTAINASGTHTSLFSIDTLGVIVAKGIPHEDSLNYRQLVWDLSDSTIKSVARGVTFADTNTLIATKADLAGSGGSQSLSSSKSGNTVTLGISGGDGTVFSVADADSSTTNELQTATKVGNIVTLSGNSSAFSVADSDSSATNEIQNLSIGTRTSTTVPINISSGTGASFPIATTSLAGAMSAADKAKLDSLSTASNGTVTSVAAGNGMSFTAITGSGPVTLGTPSNITLSSTNSVTSTSHTHAFVPGGTSAQYIRGDGTLATFPTIPTVNNATLTLATSGIATGSQTFTANQSTNATFTVNVPATNVGGVTNEWGRVTSSTGTNGYVYGMRSFGNGAINALTINSTETGMTMFSNTSASTNLPKSAGGNMIYVQTNIGSALGSYKLWSANQDDGDLYFMKGVDATTWGPWKRFAFKEWVEERLGSSSDSSIKITGTTSNATPTTIATIPVPSGQVYDIQVRAIATQSGSSAASFFKGALIGNSGGTASVLGSGVAQISTPITTAGLSGADMTIETSGGNLVVKVTGVATTVNWKVFLSIIKN